GEAEVPPVETDGTGQAAFLTNGEAVQFAIAAFDLTDVVAAHIHGPATTENEAGILVTLFDDPGGVDPDGLFTDDDDAVFPSSDFPIDADIPVDSVLRLMREGQAYVNVHTVENPGGEIRGQIMSTN
ncbi:MAG: CHRD domain-containing protein, partial [Gemmatimonas sp.]|nr:CHRD domain-containing protein [Gemmatimonas sp.]